LDGLGQYFPAGVEVGGNPGEIGVEFAEAKVAASNFTISESMFPATILATLTGPSTEERAS
jgi:hypothetical protein